MQNNFFDVIPTFTQFILTKLSHPSSLTGTKKSCKHVCMKNCIHNYYLFHIFVTVGLQKWNTVRLICQRNVNGRRTWGSGHSHPDARVIRGAYTLCSRVFRRHTTGYVPACLPDPTHTKVNIQVILP